MAADVNRTFVLLGLRSTCGPFPATEDLVEAYLRAADADLRTAVADVLDQDSPHEAVAAPLDPIGQVTCSAGFRGCHFIDPRRP